MLRISHRVLILYLIISIIVGTGIGYAIRSGHISSLNDDIDKQEAQVATLTGDLSNLQEKTDSLTSSLQQKQADYDSLLTLYGNVSNQLETLQQDYHTLLEASCDGALMEAAQLKEQVASLITEKNKLSGQISQLQIDIATLKASLDYVIANNITLTEQIGKAESKKNQLTIEIARLNKQFTPAPDHEMPPSQVWNNPDYRSTEWANRDYELQSKVEEIGQWYQSKHVYIEGTFDCNDMAVDLWNMLLAENIKSVIIVGNRNRVGETFLESNHAWLDVFNANGEVFYLEPTTGEVIYGQLADGSINLKAVPYREGKIYKNPTDLRLDLKQLW
ncbi:MAG: hypothetical protein PHV74_10105 [Dehalococcoidia bacterium]|nr:hypothetical protein [Dehalococcoidia bacterium]